MTRTTVQGLYDGNLAVLVENRSSLRPDAAKGGMGAQTAEAKPTATKIEPAKA